MGLRFATICLLALGLFSAGTAVAQPMYPFGMSRDFRPTFTEIQFWVEGDLVDLDEDGDVDFLVSGDGESERMEWFDNEDGFGDSLEVRTISTNLAMTNHVIIDFDDDGDLDIVGDSEGSVYWLENLGRARAWTEHLLFGDGRTGYVAVADMNGDGHNDIVWAERDLYIYTNVGGDLMNWSAPITVSDRQAQELAVHDFDGDGDPDIVLATDFSDDSEIRVYENDAMRFNETIMDIDNDINSFSMIDMDGDSDMDLVIATEAIVTILENLGNLAFAPDKIADSPRDGTILLQSYVSAPGDMDGDGDMDIMVASGGGENGGLQFWENDGGNFTLVTIDEDRRYSANSLSVGDVDCDGDLDVFFGVSITLGPSEPSSRWLENQTIDAATESCHGMMMTTCEERGDCPDDCTPGVDCTCEDRGDCPGDCTPGVDCTCEERGDCPDGPVPTPEVSCGVSSASASSAPTALLFVAGLMLLRRRRRSVR